MEAAAGSTIRRGSWAVLGGLTLAVACLPEPTDPGGTTAVGTEVLTDVASEVVLPTLRRFESDAAAVRDAAAAWVDGGSRDTVSAPLLAAHGVWEELEVMQIGPAASSLTARGGQDLRDEVYSWPTVNPCLVDQKTVQAAFDDPDFFQSHLVNAYGLDALAHLVFAPGDANACPPQVDINAAGTWDALGPDGVDAQRARYALALSEGLVQAAGALVHAWEPQGGDFARLLAAPGTDDSPYQSETQALNAVFDGLFYLETVTKDRKLAEPLGLGDCSTDCADRVEAGATGTSSEWIAANLAGFSTLFTGGQGTGLDDLLAERGHANLAERIAAHAATAHTLALQLGPLQDAIETHPEDALALYDAVKAVTDDLKGDVATVLALQLPSEAAGDAD